MAISHEFLFLVLSIMVALCQSTSGRGGQYEAGANAYRGDSCDKHCVIIFSVIFGAIILAVILVVLFYYLKNRRLRQKSRQRLLHPITREPIVVYHDDFIDPTVLPSSGNHVQGKYDDAPLEPFLHSNQFTKDFPPQKNLPPSEHIEHILRCKGLGVWRFISEPGEWRVQRSTHISSDGRTISFGPNEDAMVQTNYPFFSPTHKKSEVFYFEVTVIEKKKSSATLAVGLATKPYPAYRLPGWNLHSVGFHSDEGDCYKDDGFGAKKYGPSWDEGDTVGVGYRWDSGTVFFTLNGDNLGAAYTRFKHVLFPCIGSDGTARVIVNFGDEGKPFLCEEMKGFGPGGRYDDMNGEEKNQLDERRLKIVLSQYEYKNKSYSDNERLSCHDEFHMMIQITIQTVEYRHGLQFMCALGFTNSTYIYRLGQ